MKPSESDFIEWNEAHAIKHDLDKFYNHPNRIFRFIENTRIKRLIKAADINENNKVLEIGCGAGHILERINKGFLTGIDISETQIKRAQKRLGNKVKLIKAPAEHLPFENESFDRVICTEVFEHVLEPETVLNEMNRVLKKDGIISLSIPNENLIIFTKGILLNFGFRWVLEPKESKWDLASKNNLDEWHIHRYSIKLIKKQVSNSFKINFIQRIPFFMLPYRYVLQIQKRQ
jgi:ubiquinone/menaquinone biosynthesis C-methylase UbiE